MRRLLKRFARPFSARLSGVHDHVDDVTARVVAAEATLTAALETGLEQTRHEIHAARHETYSLLVQDLDAGTEATTLLSRGLQDTRAAIEDAVDDIRIEIDKLAAVPLARRVEDIDARVAELLRHADGPEGFRAQLGIWSHPAVRVRYEAGAATVEELTAGIVEAAHALRALHDLPAGSRVLHLAADDQALSLSLAALGYRVLAVRDAPTPIEHPNLLPLPTDPVGWPVEDGVAAIVCLAATRQPAMALAGPDGLVEQARGLLVPGGRLVCSLRYGTPGPASPLGTVSPAQLAEALTGWDDVEVTVVKRVDPTTWLPVDADLARAHDGTHQVALVGCRRPPGS